MDAIVVTYRNNGSNNGAGDYHACFENDTATWECGRTSDETIGKLMRSTQQRTGIKIVDAGPLKRIPESLFKK